MKLSSAQLYQKVTDPKIDDILIYSDVKVNKRLNKPAEFLVDLTTYNEMQF